jgi:hypothetical protein
MLPWKRNYLSKVGLSQSTPETFGPVELLTGPFSRCRAQADWKVRAPRTEILQVEEHGLLYHLMVVVSRIVMILALVAAGWSIHANLPGDEALKTQDGSATTGPTELLITLHHGQSESGGRPDIPVEFYPIDLSAAQDAFARIPRPGVRFEDFLAQRMGGQAPVSARLDDHGQATLMLQPGKWWVHAVLPGAENLEWRLPVNVAGRRQTVDLTAENAYARTRSF